MKVFLVMFICFLPVLSFANGSPIDESAYKNSGQIKPIIKNGILLKKEGLKVTLVKDWAIVRVKYSLENTGGNTKTAYAFPVLNGKVGMDDGYRQDIHEVIKGFKYTLNGKETGFTWDVDDKGGKWWAVVNLELPGGRESELIVSYIVRVDFSDMVYSKSFKPECNKREFRYDFKLANNWAESKPDLDIEVDASPVVIEGGNVSAVEPAAENNGNDIYHINLVRADLKKIPGLYIGYNRSKRAFEDYLQQWRVTFREGVVFTNDGQSMKFPATLEGNTKEYSPDNLFDDDPKTVWATKASPDKLPLTIRLSAPSIHGIGILNGIYKNKNYYYENCRIKSGTVMLVSDPDSDVPKYDKGSFSLPDRRFEDFDPVHPYESLDWILDLGDVNGPMNVVIVIDQVYKGTKYDDLCLSEMFVVK